MASYDAARGCYVVRIVYDGPGLAGKTTNLKEVCNFVSAKRRSELYTPAELKGRTMFFDWLEVDGPPGASSDQVSVDHRPGPGAAELPAPPAGRDG